MAIEKNPLPYDKKIKTRYLPDIQYISHLKGDISQFTFQQYGDLCKIIYIKKGHATFIVNNHVYVAPEGSMFICNPNTIHSESYEADCELYILLMNEIFLARLDENHVVHDGKSPVVSVKKYSSEINAFIYFIYEEFYSKPIKYEQSYRCLLLALLGIIDRCYQEGFEIVASKELIRSSNQLHLDIQKYLNEHFHEAISLQKVADHFFINASYLSHLIKKEFTFSFTEYIRYLRLGAAQNLLISTELPLARIANKIGYKDAKYFLNLFKKELKMTPTQFRQQARLKGVFRDKASKKSARV